MKQGAVSFSVYGVGVIIVFYWQEMQEYTKTVVRYCLETLQIWFDAIGFVDEVK